MGRENSQPYCLIVVVEIGVESFFLLSPSMGNWSGSGKEDGKEISVIMETGWVYIVNLSWGGSRRTIAGGRGPARGRIPNVSKVQR